MFREVRSGHENTDWHTDMCLSHPPNPGQKLSAPFPFSHVHWMAQKRCCSLLAGCPGCPGFSLQSPAVITLFQAYQASSQHLEAPLSIP